MREALRSKVKATHGFLEEKDGHGSDQRHVAQQRLQHHPHHSMKLHRKTNDIQHVYMY